MKFWDNKFLPYVFISIIGFLLYFKILNFELTFLDDHIWVQDYHWFLKDFKNIPQFFVKPDFISGLFYRPLLNISFMVNSAVGGTETFTYHLTNIIFHVLNGCFLFGLLTGLKYHKRASLVFCLIFLVHPALVSSVAWIPGRTDSLLAFFVLPSMIFFVKYLSSSRKIWLFLHIIFFIAALLVKETAVGIPLVAGCFLLLSGKRNRLLLMSLLWVIVLSSWLVVRQYILRDAQGVGFVRIVQSLIENAPAMISYVGKVFLPVNVSVLPVLKDLPLIYGWVSLVILFILAIIFGIERKRYFFFGVFWFGVFLLPSLVISFLKHEYRLYLPMIGCFFILYEMKFFKVVAADRKKGIPLFAVVFIIFTALSLRHMNHYREKMVFWNNAVEASPHSPLAHRNLGAMLYLENNLDAAEEQYRKAIEISPHEAMVHNNLGLIYADRNQPQKAQQEYLAEIAINPDYDNVYFNLGVLYYSQGYKQEAVESWKKTIALNAKYLEAYWNLTAHYLRSYDVKNSEYYMGELQRMGVEIPEEYKKALWQIKNL